MDISLTQVTSRDTSSDSFNAISARQLANQEQRVLDVILGLCRNGARDVSRLEVREAYERIYATRIDAGRIAARVKGLIDGGRVEECPEPRACCITGRQIKPVRPVAQQARLV